MPDTATIRKVGILSGTFDPVHIGHITLALQAAEAAGLDKVFLVPEASPRRKIGVTHLAHRVAMIKLAIMPHSKLGVLELPDKNFTVATTIPRLKQVFPGCQLYYICGSDMLEHMPSWHLIERLFATMPLVVGLNRGDTLEGLQSKLAQLPSMRKTPIILQTPKGTISSSIIRLRLAKSDQAEGMLGTTRAYIKRNWLYSVTS